MALSDEGRCTLWGTPDFPMVCRIHVCNQKIFTKKELSEIEDIEERDCPNCNAEWMKTRFKSGNMATWECEICGYELEWKGKVVKRGKTIN